MAACWAESSAHLTGASRAGNWVALWAAPTVVSTVGWRAARMAAMRAGMTAVMSAFAKVDHSAVSMASLLAACWAARMAVETGPWMAVH
jgi:hypothetical protein